MDLKDLRWKVNWIHMDGLWKCCEMVGVYTVMNLRFS